MGSTIPPYWDLLPSIWGQNQVLLATVERLATMAGQGFTDLQSAVSSLQSEQVTFLQNVQAALQNGDSDTALEAIAQQLNTLTSAQEAADPGAPVPAPPVTPVSGS
jgi:DNA-binding FadR family transcriptional regulator